MKRIAIAVAALFLFACDPAPPCEFGIGEIVRSVISGEVGQVVDNPRALHGVSERQGFNCYANVRFDASQALTNTRVLSNDGPVSILPLALIKYMKPFELEPARIER